ncbi:MAG: sigma-70 family RNA polymerase sigma factor [Chloroflexi bacterium]|nr:sigma-70 family RNA polymerase sigma factor [Chloroflexota bacterium]
MFPAQVKYRPMRVAPRPSSARPRALDAQAFGRLYDSNVSKVYRYIYYKVGTAMQAEDLTAQVFMKAWEALDRYRWTQRPFSAWLFRIAHNLVVDHFRTQRDTLSIEGLPFEIDAHAESLDILAQRKLTAAELKKAISRLTDSQQQVIVLKFLEGYSTEETARIMRKDPGAVRALQHRALTALQRTCRPWASGGYPW